MTIRCLLIYDKKLHIASSEGPLIFLKLLTPSLGTTPDALLLVHASLLGSQWAENEGVKVGANGSLPVLKPCPRLSV